MVNFTRGYSGGAWFHRSSLYCRTHHMAHPDSITSFGSFRIRHRNSRKGRNPKTGSSVEVPQKRVPFFKVGKRLRELVNA